MRESVAPLPSDGQVHRPLPRPLARAPRFAEGGDGQKEATQAAPRRRKTPCCRQRRASMAMDRRSVLGMHQLLQEDHQYAGYQRHWPVQHCAPRHQGRHRAGRAAGAQRARGHRAARRAPLICLHAVRRLRRVRAKEAGRTLPQEPNRGAQDKLRRIAKHVHPHTKALLGPMWRATHVPALAAITQDQSAASPCDRGPSPSRALDSLVAAEDYDDEFEEWVRQQAEDADTPRHNLSDPDADGGIAWPPVSS